MSNPVEIGAGSALAGLAVLAQVTGTDLFGGAIPDMIVVLLKAGTAGILGGITVYSLYRGGKTAEMLAQTFKETMASVEAAHKGASEQFSKDVERLVEADTARMAILDRAIQHCASVNGVSR
jgi:hypothetical protein